MWETAQSPRPNVLPFIRCRDPARSIEWLCRALGFETHHVALRDDGSIVFAHLRFGGRLIMVTPADDAVAVPAIDTVTAEGNALITRPAEIEDDGTQSCYFVVDDIEAHYRNAKEAGAEIVLEIEIYEQGDCRYSCRDPDGHVWTFGTYNVPAAAAGPRMALPATVGVLTVLAACGLALWLAQAPPAEEAASTDAEAQTVAAQQAQAKLTEERDAREASARSLSEALERLSREQESREAAKRAALASRDQLAGQPAQSAANAESEKLGEARAARLPAEEATRAAQEELARARAAATEQPAEAVSQTAPADGEPKAQIGARAVVTQPADEPAQPAANAESEKLAEVRAARLAAEEGARAAQEELARARAAAAAEQPTEAVSRTTPADGEPKAQIGERAVVTQPADETATKEAAPKSAGQDEDQLASSLPAKGDAAAADQPTEAVSQTAPADGEPKAQIGERIVVTPPADETATKEAAPKSVGQDEDQLASSLLAEGRSLLAKGDLEGARRAFRRAADSGLAEGALALGSTYDPASLARYGLKGSSADPESAKFWYRRAHELTQAAALKTEPVARK